MATNTDHIIAARAGAEGTSARAAGPAGKGLASGTVTGMPRSAMPPAPLGTDAALLTLAQWFSPAFPIGAFSFSHGLDWVISAGQLRSAAAVERWIAHVLAQGSGRNDLIFLAHAWRGEDPAGLDTLARALAPSAERLTETAEQGASFVRAVNAVWSLDLPPLVYPVAVGSAARACSLPLEATARMYLHAFAAALTSAAVRATPLGQTEGQAILAATSTLIDRLCKDALDAPLDDLGGAVFAADIASMNHETQYSRMFRT